MTTSACWEITCDGLMSHPGKVEDSHPHNTTENGDKHNFEKIENTSKINP